MDYLESVVLIKQQNQLEKLDTYKTGYVEAVIKITKNYAGPKIEYLREAGIMKINNGDVLGDLGHVDFSVFGLQEAVIVSNTGVGFSAKVVLSGGSVSIFDLQLAVGI